MISQSAETPQLLSSAGRNWYSSAAITAPHMLYTPPINVTASRVIESWVGKSIEYR